MVKNFMTIVVSVKTVEVRRGLGALPSAKGKSDTRSNQTVYRGKLENPSPQR